MGPGDPSGEHDASTVSRQVEGGTGTTQICRLVVIEGKDAGSSFALDPNAPSRVLLGTSPVCDVRLTDPTVSRRHVAFEPSGRRYKLTDLGSTNGTFVDGVAVVEAFVRGGEVVRCGSTALRVESEVGEEPAPLPSAMRFGRMIGASVAMRRLYPLCERLAASRVPVIIEGETGTGKEVLAESIHEIGGGGPFVVFDCTTVSPSLVEAELFGHERGAFTGAVNARAGVFEEAHGGTLLIDEIGDLDLPLQAKLLRAIERKEIRRVGGRQSIIVEVRVLAATRRDLDKAVAQGQFRDDLYHRLAVARIELPPLRERTGDVRLLARQFAIEMAAGPDALSEETLARYEEYAWPGNVRELRNAVARYIALGEDLASRLSDAPSAANSPPGMSSRAGGADWLDQLTNAKMPFPIARRRALEEFERRYVESALAAHNGNVSAAARSSGLALRYFRLVKARGKKP